MQVIKRDGTQVEFEIEKITTAIFEAAKAVGGDDMNLAIELAKVVLKELNENFKVLIRLENAGSALAFSTILLIVSLVCSSPRVGII